MGNKDNRKLTLIIMTVIPTKNVKMLKYGATDLGERSDSGRTGSPFHQENYLSHDGFKAFHSRSATINGIETGHMI